MMSRGQLGVGQIDADAIDQVFELLDGVAAVHLLEHAVGAGLHGQVEISADARAIAHDFENVVAEVAREAGDEAQTLKVGDLIVDVRQQVGEGGGLLPGSPRIQSVVSAVLPRASAPVPLFLMMWPTWGCTHAVHCPGRRCGRSDSG